jgi:hypothetical protein
MGTVSYPATGVAHGLTFAGAELEENFELINTRLVCPE